MMMSGYLLILLQRSCFLVRNHFDMPVEIHITKSTFHPGEVILGDIVYTKRSGRSFCNGIYFSFRGYEQVLLVQDNVYHNETFYQKRTQVQGTQPGQHTATLELHAGTYRWPFSVQIPVNIPPSFKHLNGKCSINYMLLAEIGEWCKKSARSCSFLILSAYLSIFSESAGSPLKQAMQPIVIIPNPQSRFLINLPAFDAPRATNADQRHSLFVNVLCDRAIYRQGEDVSVQVLVKNDGSHAVEGLKIAVVQSFQFSDHSEKVVAKDFVYRRIHVAPLSTFQGTLMARIPEQLFPSILHQRLFSMHYFIVVESMLGSQLVCSVAVPIIVVPRSSVLPSEMQQQQQPTPPTSMPPPLQYNPSPTPPRNISSPDQYHRAPPSSIYPAMSNSPTYSSSPITSRNSSSTTPPPPPHKRASIPPPPSSPNTSRASYTAMPVGVLTPSAPDPSIAYYPGVQAPSSVASRATPPAIGDYIASPNAPPPSPIPTPTTTSLQPARLSNSDNYLHLPLNLMQRDTVFPSTATMTIRESS
jgi:hypothetical protein